LRMKTQASMKQRVVTSKVEEEVAAFLAGMPNKSEFIRKALLSALLEPCPICHGRGSVPQSLRRDLEKILSKHKFVACSYCGYQFPLKPGRLRNGASDRERLRQYLGGGDFYCGDCFGKTETCARCGEHVAQGRMMTHKRQHRRRA